MHPSNYTQFGRRRSNSKSEDNLPSANHLSVNDRNSIRRSQSGSDVINSYKKESHYDPNKPPNRHSLSDICSHSPDDDLEWEGFKQGVYNDPPVYQTASNCIPEVRNVNRNSENLVDSAVIAKARRRSGSWNGVNESDEDIEQMTFRPNPAPVHIVNSTIRSESIESAREAQSDFCYGPSYQNSFVSSYSTTDTINGTRYCLPSEQKMKRRLKYFFMNPIEKWKAKRRLPWKLFVQIIKIVIVTAQLCMFASQRYNHVTYLSDTKISFSHLFIKEWDPSREIVAYPPASGPLALYKVQEFYSFLDFAIINFFSVENDAIGSYYFERHNGTKILPTLCMSHFVFDSFTTKEDSNSQFDNTVVKSCIKIPDISKDDDWSSKTFLDSHNKSINFDLLLDATLNFRLKTMKLNSKIPYGLPECYRLDAILLLNNADQDGQMVVTLEVGALILDCKGSVRIKKGESEYHKIRTAVNIVTMTICSISFLLCLRTIFRAQLLQCTTNGFFQIRFGRRLTGWEKFEFINLWYVLICINDLLIIIGSAIKVGLETQKGYIDGENLMSQNADYEGYLDKWNICSLFLGLGNLLVWFGCLRYLGFFETYNVLILTIKNCLPNVIRYSICILMVFAGYSFCGWLVLGPYHGKFRSLSSTIECLYSLINGDDMFATYSSTEGKDPLVWWFSRIYLYTFISLFIYVILSLFIAIIMDAYDTVKSYYDHGFPCTELMRFANECEDDPDTGIFHDEEDRTIHDVVNWMCCCGCFRSRSHSGYEALPT